MKTILSTGALVAALAVSASAQGVSEKPLLKPLPKPVVTKQQPGLFFGGSDDCSTPTTILGQGTFAFDNTAATTGVEGQAESICLFFGSDNIAADVWVEWTADATGDATVATCGSTFDTKIAAYPAGGCPVDGTAIACNDDSCGLQSSMTFPVTAGTAYLLQLGSFPSGSPATGVGTLDISIAGGGSDVTADDCSTADSIAGQGTFSFDNTAATTGFEGQAESICLFFGSDNIAADVWTEWTADVTGDATVATCGTTFDTKIAAYPGGGCPVDGSALACNDDSCGLQSSMTFPVTAGTTYLLQLGSFPSGSPATGVGTLDISITPPAPDVASDDCATPDSIAGQGTFSFDNTAATTGVEGQAESICLFFGSDNIAADVWTEWTADATGDATIATCGTTFDTKIAAYPAGGCPVDGSALACNDDSCGLQSSMTFSVTAGTTYLLQLGSFPSGTPGTGVGTLDISILPADADVEADDCATPDVLLGPGSYTFNNGAATTGTEGQAESLCDFFGQTGVALDVWVEWTATSLGTATVSTCGSSFDTKIAAYPAGGCPVDGSAIACNDDDCGLQSSMSFYCEPGDVFLIQVGSFPSGSPTGGLGVLDISIDPEVGTAYCFGNACPCGNDDAAAGCANSTGFGALLGASGSLSVAADDLVMTVTGAPAGEFGLVYMGSNTLSLPFGDGLRCAGGNTYRYPVQPVDGTGSYSQGGMVAFSQFFNVNGKITVGQTWNFQGWYRDSGAACGAGMFNLTNGYTVTFQP